MRESNLSFNAADEISQIQPYGSQGQTLTPAVYSYNTAGDQTGNNGGGTDKPLSIAYAPTNQTQSITNQTFINPQQPSLGLEPVSLTWAGAGQAERVKESWTDQGTNYTNTYTYSLVSWASPATPAIATATPRTPARPSPTRW